MEITKEKNEVVKETKQVEEVPKKIKRSWKPASLTEIPEKYKDPNFEYYLATTNRPGNIQKKLAEGLQIDKKIAPAMRADGALPDFPATLQDGQPADNTLRFRELIVMRIPKDLAQARREYYEEKSNRLYQSKIAESEVGNSGYGKVIAEKKEGF